MEGTLPIELSILFTLLLILRCLYLMHKITTGNTAFAKSIRKNPAKTVICIGSGGHTTEMLQLLKGLNFERYTPRYYIIAKSDTTSLSRVEKFEAGITGGKYNIILIPRSRVVGQSYVTSILTTLYSVLYSIPVMVRLRPDLILCNGPGTCVPICLIAFVMKALFICDNRIMFIESFCRTKTFSLTGKILIYIADNFLVHWPSLKYKSKRVTYIGQLL